MAKIISVFGPPNSGTSILSTLIGLVLSERGNVGIIYCDNRIPTIPVIYPSDTLNVTETKKIQSIGKILTSPKITDEDILRQVVTIPNWKRVGLLGYAYGENKDTYAYPTSYDVVELLNKFSNMTDYIVVDCGSDIEDTLPAIALENSDNIIRVCGCEYKDIVYYASNLQFVSENTVSHKNHITVFPKTKIDDAPEDLRSFYGSIDYIGEYSKVMEEIVRQGQILFTRPPAQYLKMVKKIVEEMSFIG